ncbi:type II secretion system protein N [Caenimonas aquaedulcis]|uniref:Type II secretion system protein GspC N-terminal domain-containing protein n=1 Tax=Caenimonas aquaedulcis TaxID=2793270 RepID=A0A931H3J5_9BURK|nr:hypothetical protein [Caenimonas aquaedulcis]
MSAHRPIRCAALAALALALAACDRAAPPAEPAKPAPAVRVPDTAPAAAPPVAAAPALTPPAMALKGVMSFGPEDRRSEALLAVGDSSAQAFHPGDTIAGGWSLRSVASDHIVIAQGATTHRIDLSTAPAASPPSTAAASARIAPQDKPLPGFVESAPPRFSATDGQASARNRAFLEGRMQRRGAASQPGTP